jgi:hypothetical protein
MRSVLLADFYKFSVTGTTTKLLGNFDFLSKVVKMVNQLYVFEIIEFF